MKRNEQFMSYEELYEAYQNCYDCMCRWENNYHDLKKQFLQLDKFCSELKQNIANGDVNHLVYLDRCQELEKQVADLEEAVASYQRIEKSDIHRYRVTRKNLFITLADYAAYKGYSLRGAVSSDNLRRAARKYRQAAMFRQRAIDIQEHSER